MPAPALFYRALVFAFIGRPGGCDGAANSGADKGLKVGDTDITPDPSDTRNSCIFTPVSVF